MRTKSKFHPCFTFVRLTSPNTTANPSHDRDAGLRAARAVIINETFCNQIRDSKSRHQESIQLINRAPQAVLEAPISSAPTKIDQSHQQLVVQISPWKEVGGVIVIDDD